MPTKENTSKSSSEPTISRFNNNVESRLQVLEAQIHTLHNGGDERIAALEAKVDDLINKLSKKMTL